MKPISCVLSDPEGFLWRFARTAYRVARKQRMKRMLNGFKRYGITCPAQTGCQPNRLS